VPTHGGTPIELRQLRYFLAVSEELHFRRAAERLNMAQPPLSQAIRKLESELGVALFERTTRVVDLTEAGRVLAAQARHVLSTVDIAITETRRAGGIGCGLRIGFTPHLPIEQLLLFLGALQEREPEARTEVTHASAVEQLKSLADGDLDIAMLPWANDREGLQVEPIFPGEPLAAFLPGDHRLAERRTLGPADLAEETLVSFPRDVNPALSDWLRSRREHSGYRFRDMREVDGQHARDWILAVAAGSGIALLPHRFKEFADAGTLVTRRPLDPRLAMPDTVVAWRTDDDAPLMPLIAAAGEVAGELRADRD
jgi:DNA-binding transcriptional LysR family regulator